MAGGGNQEENPVAINVVAMVDIIFCLCLFFMCSLKFKPLDAKFDSWLPKDKGGAPSAVQNQTNPRLSLRTHCSWSRGRPSAVVNVRTGNRSAESGHAETRATTPVTTAVRMPMVIGAVLD